MNGDTVIALDLGGTKLLIGEVDKEGRILSSKSYPSGYLKQEQAVELICSSLDDFLATARPSGPEPAALGVGLIGLVDAAKGDWVMIDPGRKSPVALASLLQERYGYPCRLENDVKAAALAERTFGAGRATDHFIYLNIGTGIAAGIVADGQLIRGLQNDAGEVGHMTVDYTSGTPCVCGRFGCAEAIASGGGMDRRLRLLGQRYPGSPLLQLASRGFVRAEEVFAHADKGDPLAVRIAGDAADAAAELIMNLVRVVNPELVILGGGVAGSAWMGRELPKRLELPVMDSVAKGVIFSRLDPATVGLVGAATLALS
ncbi:putative NBD/HSP70 family sugar kinase [Paenibacillus rhizosphaerae]|uniref:Putative NBD/HSP70 family sugar kinase n=1 Tax=Paenibacillus rhizosphaerae TaxID=297318 RepID=A0A839TNE9_9BACL|nr:ROK family protein [Paenibacillus rhizosphaerae]MBB3128424.1 putative NBD/HSP70 family sugar kinase [Paenibacillus rhizosphaerae]